MDPVYRIFIERIKGAKKIQIVADNLTLDRFIEDKILAHDIAIALQAYYGRLEKSANKPCKRVRH